jgi:hypothetical protein
MALSVFGKSLAKRPAPLKPTLGPPTSGKIINKMPTPVRPFAPAKPIAQVISRVSSPLPEHSTSSTPDHLQSRAINNVNAVVRMPDRGSAIVLQGVTLTMPDGTSGRVPNLPPAIRQTLSPVFSQVVASGGNTNVRQTQMNTLAREAYLDRQRNRDVTASIGVMKRRGMIQRQGLSYIAKPFPSTLGALEKAQLWRIKEGTPTGIVGDRATNYPSAHVGAVYSKTVAPLVTNQTHTDAKIGGTGTTAAPIPTGAATIAQPNMSAVESIGKAFAWAPADAAPSSAAPSAAGGLTQTAERWGLLIGVAVLAFFLIRKS